MPSFSDFPKDLYFPQNLPSILVIEELAPEPGQIILDMCASPGGKSSHAAIKMNNRGLLLALDKNETKVVKLQATLAQQNITSARAYAADSSKLASASQDEGCIPENFIGKGEKIKPNSFDSVILDPPCSGIGQRPVIPSSSFSPQTKGFSQYQKRLLSQAVALVKSNGLIAYSTCTLVPEENEGVIAHAVQDLGLVLECPKFSFGDRGLEGHGLSKDDCLKVKRFWPGGPDDSIAFFYAILRKP
jgi:16S rRNA C967 or C1407 C5-methylase (RsmB/RsmF family)